MVTINVAYTESINPTGATPTLTREQVWRALQRKVRRAEDFIPVIERTEVVQEDGDEVVRIAHFKSLHGKPPGEMKEVCTSFYPSKVDFRGPNGATICNIVSNAPSLEANDLNLTFTFEWKYPEVEAGGEKAASLFKEHTEGAQKAVHGTIEAMRRLAQAGELD